MTRSKTATTCGWFSRAASRASRSARSRSGGLAAGHHPDPLDGHVAAEHLVAGEPDGAHAAAPDLAVEVYLPAIKCVLSCAGVAESYRLSRPCLLTKPGGRRRAMGQAWPDVHSRNRKAHA